MNLEIQTKLPEWKGGIEKGRSGYEIPKSIRSKQIWAPGVFFGALARKVPRAQTKEATILYYTILYHTIPDYKYNYNYNHNYNYAMLYCTILYYTTLY